MSECLNRWNGKGQQEQEMEEKRNVCRRRSRQVMCYIFLWANVVRAVKNFCFIGHCCWTAMLVMMAAMTTGSTNLQSSATPISVSSLLRVICIYTLGDDQGCDAFVFVSRILNAVQPVLVLRIYLQILPLAMRLLWTAAKTEIMFNYFFLVRCRLVSVCGRGQSDGVNLMHKFLVRLPHLAK